MVRVSWKGRWLVITCRIKGVNKARCPNLSETHQSMNEKSTQEYESLYFSSLQGPGVKSLWPVWITWQMARSCTRLPKRTRYSWCTEVKERAAAGVEQLDYIYDFFQLRFCLLATGRSSITIFNISHLPWAWIKVLKKKSNKRSMIRWKMTSWPYWRRD